MKDMKNTMETIKTMFMHELEKTPDKSISLAQAEMLAPFGIAYLVMDEMMEEKMEAKMQGDSDIEDELHSADTKLKLYTDTGNKAWLTAAESELNHAKLYMDMHKDYAMQDWYDSLKLKIKAKTGMSIRPATPEHAQ